MGYRNETGRQHHQSVHSKNKNKINPNKDKINDSNDILLQFENVTFFANDSDSEIAVKHDKIHEIFENNESKQPIEDKNESNPCNPWCKSLCTLFKTVDRNTPGNTMNNSLLLSH